MRATKLKRDAEMRTGMRSALVGVIAGMRSSSAPALVGQIRAHKNRNGSKTKNVLGALFVGELIADLLPFMPARTKPFSLLARMVSGASSAARLDADRREKLRAALLGAAGALGASFLFYQLRKGLGHRYDIPDRLAGAWRGCAADRTRSLAAKASRRRRCNQPEIASTNSM
jgi:uncharacterized membrane protein